MRMDGGMPGGDHMEEEEDGGALAGMAVTGPPQALAVSKELAPYVAMLKTLLKDLYPKVKVRRFASSSKICETYLIGGSQNSSRV